MQVPFFNLSLQNKPIKNLLLKKIEEIMDEGYFIGGTSVKRLEESLKKYYNWAHCITVGNGTDGLILALKALGIGHGDQVIVPAYSWISTAHAVAWVGAQPIFIDVEEENWTLDLAQIANNINPKVKAWIPVHLLGQKISEEKIMDTATKWNLATIEDGAQLHGIPWLRKKSDAHLLVQSFYPTKQLGAYGDGGAVFTESEELSKTIRKLANYGAEVYNGPMNGIGINSRLDTMQAAILQVKMNYLQDWVAKRKKIAFQYQQRLAQVSGITLLNRWSQDSFYFFPIKTNNKDELKAYLQSKGIESRSFYPYTLPHSAPYFLKERFPVAESIVHEALCLPLFPELTESQIAYVCDHITNFFT